MLKSNRLGSYRITEFYPFVGYDSGEIDIEHLEILSPGGWQSSIVRSYLRKLNIEVDLPIRLSELVSADPNSMLALYSKQFITAPAGMIKWDMTLEDMVHAYVCAYSFFYAALIILQPLGSHSDGSRIALTQFRRPVARDFWDHFKTDDQDDAPPLEIATRLILGITSHYVARDTSGIVGPSRHYDADSLFEFMKKCAFDTYMSYDDNVMRQIIESKIDKLIPRLIMSILGININQSSLEFGNVKSLGYRQFDFSLISKSAFHKFYAAVIGSLRPIDYSRDAKWLNFGYNLPYALPWTFTRSGGQFKFANIRFSDIFNFDLVLKGVADVGLGFSSSVSDPFVTSVFSGSYLNNAISQIGESIVNPFK